MCQVLSCLHYLKFFQGIYANESFLKQIKDLKISTLSMAYTCQSTALKYTKIYKTLHSFILELKIQNNALFP